MNSDEKIKKVLFALMPVIVFAVMISLGQLLFGINSIKFSLVNITPTRIFMALQAESRAFLVTHKKRACSMRQHRF